MHLLNDSLDVRVFIDAVSVAQSRHSPFRAYMIGLALSVCLCSLQAYYDS